MIRKSCGKTSDKGNIEHSSNHLLLNVEPVLLGGGWTLTCMKEDPGQLVEVSIPVGITDVQALALKVVPHLVVDIFLNRIVVARIFNCDAE